MWPASGASPRKRFRRPGYSARGNHGSDPSRRNQSAAFDLLQSAGLAARCGFTREALEKLEFFGVVDFFLSETAQHADVVLAGSLQEEEEGVVCSAEGRVIHIQQGRRSARQCAGGLADHVRPGSAAWARQSISRSLTPARFSTNCARPRAEASRTTTASLTRKSMQQMGVFWPCPSLDHPGTPRLFEGGVSFIPMEKPLSTDGVARERAIRWTRVSRLPHHRAGGEPIPVRDANAPHRSAWSISIPNRVSKSTRGWLRVMGIADEDWVTVDDPPRRDHVCRPWWCARSAPIRSSFRITGPVRRSANLLTHRTLDPRSKIPEFKVSACRIGNAEAADWARAGSVTRARSAFPIEGAPDVRI